MLQVGILDEDELDGALLYISPTKTIALVLQFHNSVLWVSFGEPVLRKVDPGIGHFRCCTGHDGALQSKIDTYERFIGAIVLGELRLPPI